MTDGHDAPPADPAALGAADDRLPLRRSKRDKLIAGVCGGLGRYFGLDPVIFRITFGVLAVTGGAGLVFYGFAWLLLPQEGQEDSEAKKLLTGRVEGATLAAVFAALAGCAVFLSMLGSGGLGTFSVLVILALAGASYWSRQRRGTLDPEAEAPASQRPAHPPVPPETKAPPTPGGPSWWRDPLVKDGTTGPVGGTGYLWGPAGAAAAGPAPDGAAAAVVAPPAAPVRPRGGIGGRVFLLAVLAGAVGAAAHWQGRPLGEALQAGLAAALVVFGLGLAVSSLFGRTGLGTVLLAVLASGLLAGAAALPREIGTDWQRVDWRPAAVAAVRPVYEADTGLATLDLSRLDVPKGTTVAVRVSLDAGRLKVVVPREVTARADVRVRLGDVQLPGDRADRIEGVRDQNRVASLPPAAGTEAGGTIELHLTAGVGQVEVARAAS
ncbi:PspC domain-containing protein [Streptomyces sp. NPDC002990]